jgi:hypothetical protein
MNKLLQVFRYHRSNKEHLAQPSAPITGASAKLAGIVFVYLTANSSTLGSDLGGAVRLAVKGKARVFGMVAGLLQFLIEDESTATLEDRCKCLADGILDSIGGRGIAVWTVGQCSIGCWGNNECLNYGVLVPNFQQLMTAIGSGRPGQAIRV